MVKITQVAHQRISLFLAFAAESVLEPRVFLLVFIQCKLQLAPEPVVDVAEDLLAGGVSLLVGLLEKLLEVAFKLVRNPLFVRVIEHSDHGGLIGYLHFILSPH